MVASQVRRAWLRVERLPRAVSQYCYFAGRDRAGYSVAFRAGAVTDDGRRYERKRVVFVAPHDPLCESRRDPGYWGLEGLDGALRTSSEISTTVGAPATGRHPVARNMAVADALYEHVLGAGDPTGRLVEEGKLPDGWAEEYGRLLALAEHEWLGRPLWTRTLVTAIYWALTHLDIRYRAWQNAESGGKRDEVTERELASICGPTRFFFIRWMPLSRPDAPDTDATDDPRDGCWVLERLKYRRRGGQPRSRRGLDSSIGTRGPVVRRRGVRGWFCRTLT